MWKNLKNMIQSHQYSCTILINEINANANANTTLLHYEGPSKFSRVPVNFYHKHHYVNRMHDPISLLKTKYFIINF